MNNTFVSKVIFLTSLLALFVICSLILIGCENRNADSGDDSGPTVVVREVASILIDYPSTNPYTMITDSIKTETISVRVTNRANIPLDSVSVKFDTEKAVLTVTQDVTDGNGRAIAELQNKDKGSGQPIFDEQINIVVSAGSQEYNLAVHVLPDSVKVVLEAFNSVGDEVYEMTTGISDSLRLVGTVQNRNGEVIQNYPLSFRISDNDYQIAPAPSGGSYSTDENGQVTVYLSDTYTRQDALTSPQTVDVVAYVPNKLVGQERECLVQLQMLPPPSEFGLVLTASPTEISAGDGTPIEIRASLRDSLGRSVQDENIRFYIQNATQQEGHLQYSEVVTGNETTVPGIAKNYYYNDYTTDSAVDSIVNVCIVAEYYAIRDSVTVQIRPFPNYILEVEASPEHIDGGTSEQAIISSYLSRDGVGYADKWLDIYIPMAPFDYSYEGQVELVLEEEGEAGLGLNNKTGSDGVLNRSLAEYFNPVPREPREVLIIVKNDTLDVRDSVFVTVDPVNYNMSIRVTEDEIPAGVNAADSILASVFRNNGALVQNCPIDISIPTAFQYDNQVWLEIGASSSNSEGILTRVLREGFDPPPGERREVRIIAKNDSLGVRDSVSMTIVPPEEYYRLTVNTDRNFQNADGNYGDFCTITATLETVQGEPVMGQRVFFSTSDDIGVIPSSAITDSSGNAIVLFHDGFEEPIDQPVEVQVHASWLSGRLNDVTATITIVPWVQSPTSLEVVFSTPRIQVANTGGLEECIVTATVLDQTGQPIPFAEVDFRLSGMSGGENLDGEGLFVTKSANISGVATVSIYSGTRPGTLRLDVKSGLMNWQTYRNVTIAAGPPNSILLGYDLGNIMAYGGTYQIVCSAIVNDVYSNPVEDSTNVYWSVSPDVAQIDAFNSWTANSLPISGQVGQPVGPLAGTAYTYLRAESNIAYMTLDLIAECDSVRAVESINIDIGASGFLHIEVLTEVQLVTLAPPDDGEDDNCVDVLVSVIAADEFQIPVSGVIVKVTTLECGFIPEPDDDPPGPGSVGVTNELGIYETIFRVCYNDFDIPATYGCEITAYQFVPLRPEINGSIPIQVRVLQPPE